MGSHNRIGRHYALLPVADYEAPPGMERPVWGSIYFDMLAVQDKLDQWHQHLHLPADYQLTAGYYDAGKQSWLLIMEHPALPPVEAGTYPPMLSLAYERQEDGTHVLKHIFLKGEDLLCKATRERDLQDQL